MKLSTYALTVPVVVSVSARDPLKPLAPELAERAAVQALRGALLKGPGCGWAHMQMTCYGAAAAEVGQHWIERLADFHRHRATRMEATAGRRAERTGHFPRHQRPSPSRFDLQVRDRHRR